MATVVLNDVAKTNIGRYLKLPKHCMPLAMIEESNARVLGWAKWTQVTLAYLAAQATFRKPSPSVKWNN